MIQNKNNMIKYIMKHDKTIKSFDYAIPSNFKKQLDILGINRQNYMSIYYKNFSFDCINLLDKIQSIYMLIYVDLIKNDYDFNLIVNKYNLDIKETIFIKSFFSTYELIKDKVLNQIFTDDNNTIKII